MLTGQQKRYLRSEAHHLNAIFQVGKEGVTHNQVKGINDALEAHELIKVKCSNKVGSCANCRTYNCIL